MDSHCLDASHWYRCRHSREQSELDLQIFAGALHAKPVKRDERPPDGEQADDDDEQGECGDSDDRGPRRWEALTEKGEDQLSEHAASGGRLAEEGVDDPIDQADFP